LIGQACCRRAVLLGYAIAFPTPLLMAATGCDECLVLLGIHRLQLVEGRQPCPDVTRAPMLLPTQAIPLPLMPC